MSIFNIFFRVGILQNFAKAKKNFFFNYYFFFLFLTPFHNFSLVCYFNLGCKFVHCFSSFRLLCIKIALRDHVARWNNKSWVIFCPAQKVRSQKLRSIWVILQTTKSMKLTHLNAFTKWNRYELSDCARFRVLHCF